MAEPNINPAPRNVSSINGQQGIDLSNVGKYDENTSLDDIAGAYTGVGKQIGQIVNQAAEHVGDIQTKLVGNDFGGTNPYMYDTYYEPGANQIQSDWRAQGAQKALTVGMDRGKKAAEEAAKAAQDNYNNAVNDYNQAVENFQNAVSNPTIATVDLSALGEGNTVDEFINMNDLSGSREDVQRRYLQSAVTDRVGTEWDDKSERWSNTVKATMEHMGVSQEQYDAWTPEERQAMWDSNEATMFFNNYYNEDYIRATMGEESLKNYRESYNSVLDAINRIYDYSNGLVQELNLEPIKTINRQYGDLNDQSQMQKAGEAALQLQSLNNDKTAYEIASSDEWINKNIREDKREEFKQWIETNKVEHSGTGAGTTFGIMTGVPRGVKYYTIDKNALAEFAKGKFAEDAEGLHGQKINNKIELEEADTNQEVRSMFGFDVDSLRWYQSMKTEHPDVLNTLSSQIAQAYGETSVMEIADGEKWYLVNGEYVQPKAGSVILFAMPGVMNADGTFANKDYETFVDCFKKLNNAAANYSDEEIKNLQNTMQEAWTKYFQTIYVAKIAESFTGTTMDEDIYKSIMYRNDPSNENYANLTVDGKKISDIVKEWKDLADSDGHKAYTNLANLLLQAYSNAGFFYAMDQYGNLVQYNLDIGDTGEKSVGQVTLDNKDENPYKDMTAGEAMALYNIVTTSLQEYQRGNGQDKNINPYFLDDDNAGWIQESGNSALNMFGGTIDFVSAGLATAVAAIGNLFLPEDKRMDPRDNKGLSIRNAFASIWPENWGKDYYGDLVNGVSWNEMWSEGPKKGTLDYFVQMSDLQQQNLADAINPFMMELWFPKEGEEPDTSAIKRIGEGYTSRVKPLIDLGEGQVFDVYGLTTMFANGTAFSESSAKLIGGLVGGYMTGWLTMGVKEAASIAVAKIHSGANAIANKIAEQAAIRAINNTPDEAIAQGVAKQTLVQTVEQQAAKSSYGGVAELGPGKTGIAASASNSRDMAIRATSELALSDKMPKLTEGFSTEFLEKSLGASKTAAPMAGKAFTAEQAQVLANAEQTIGKQAAEAVMRETLQKTTLSLGTGLPAEAFAAMDSATQKLFTQAYNAVVNGTATATIGGAINPGNFLRSLGIDGIKEAATKVAQESASAVARGMHWTSSDTFRVLSTLGWDGASTRALLTEVTQDFYIDMIRDTMRNASNAYLTNEGWKKQSLEEYFTNPYTYIQNMTFSAIHFGSQRISAQVKDAYYSRQYNKALNAYEAAGDAEAQTAALNRINGIVNKIQKNSDLLVRRGQPYSKLKNTTEKINEDLNYVITKQYEKSGINPITGDSTKRFDSSDDFEAYLRDKRMSTNDRINIALRGLTIESQNNYILSQYELGGSDPTKLGNIRNWKINWDMQDIEQRTLDKYYDEVLHGGGSIMDRQRKMYKLYTDAIMEKYGKAIPGLEVALNNYYGKYLSDLDIRLKKNPKAQWTLGYTSLAGMTTLGDDTNDVLFGASFSNNASTVDRNASDKEKARGYRELKRILLDAIADGKDEITLPWSKDAKGKTYKLNKDGLNYLKTITAYNNSNTVHKYFDPIFGDSVQTHEHLDQKPFAQAAFQHTDAVVMGSKIATQAAEADAKAAQETITEYTKRAYNRYKGTAEEGYRAERNQEIVNANKVMNIADSDHIYKLSQDRAAAERYLDQIAEQKHGQLEHKYKEVIPRIAEIDGEIGKVMAQREYVQAVNNAKFAVKSYLRGDLTQDSPQFTIKYGENESVKVNLDAETMDMIATAAKNGGEFNSDLAMQMLTTKRNAVPRRVVPGSENAEMKRGDYTRLIKELEYDQRTNPDANHTATIIKLRQEMKENNIRHNYKADGIKKSENGIKTAIDYGYKKLEGTPLDTAETGFVVNGKRQLVKEAADYYYTPPKVGQKGGARRAEVMNAAAQPFVDFLTEGGNKLTVQDQRMIAYVQNAAEQSLRNTDTGEEPLHITVGTLKREMMKYAPDADLWMTGKTSGAIERVATLSKNGIQPEAMVAELKNILASNSKMSVKTRNKFIDTIELYNLMAENSNSIKANAFSLDALVKSGEETTTYGDLIPEADTLTSSLTNSTKYEKTQLKRMIQSAGDVLTQISNKKSPYYSQLVKKTYNDLSSSSNIAKEVKNDFKNIAFEHYKSAVKNPTPENTQFVEAAHSWAVARSESDPRSARLDDGKLDMSKVKVNAIDCINALGAANHEVMLSAYGDKDNHTYAEYMAAVNNARGFSFDEGNGNYSPQAADYIRLSNATYGQSIEQAEQGITRLMNYFPDEEADLLKKQQSYNLEGNRVAAQYMSEAQLSRRIKTEAGESLDAYGLGTLKANRYSDALKAAGRLKRIKAEMAEFGNASNVSLPDALAREAESQKAAGKQTILTQLRNDATSLGDIKTTRAAGVSIIPSSATVSDYNTMLENARRDLAVFYREAGFAKRGRISSEALDNFGNKVLNLYDTVTNQANTSLASDLLTLNSITRDNAENAFISVMANAYDESARTTFDAQTTLLENRAKDIKRRISNLPKTGKSYITPVSAESIPTQASALAEVVSGKITPEITKANPDKVYLFGDNIEDAKSGYVPTSTQAVIRGQENAIGIPTKKDRGTSENSYFTDADFNEFKKGVDNAISTAKKTGKQIVIPEDGIGTGKAQLQQRAPKCFNYLTKQLDALKQEALPATFEVSTAGDTIGKRFSALNAKFDDNSSSRLYGQELKGLTIEQAYQKLKGAGKGKAPAEDSQIGIMTSNAEAAAKRPLTKAEKEAISLKAYTDLWREWAKQNPGAIEELRDASYGKKLTDKFAKTSVTQATALETVLKETDPLRDPQFTKEFTNLPLETPDEIRSAVEKTIGVGNLSKSSQKALKDYSDYISSETKKVESSNEYQKLLDEYQQEEFKNEEHRRDADAYYSSRGLYSDDEDISGEWEFTDTRLDDFIREKVYEAKGTVAKRDALVKTINEDIFAQRKARDEKYGVGSSRANTSQGTTVASIFDRDVKVVDTNGGFKTNHPNGGRSWLRNTPEGYLLDVEAMHNAFENRTWRNPQRSEKLNVDFDTEEDMLAFGLLHERGHDFLGTKAKASEATDFETKVNEWAEQRIKDNTLEYKMAKKTAHNILKQVVSPADLLNRQLNETNAALQRHLTLDSEAMVRDGKMHFYTDQQVLSGEFGREETTNASMRYSSSKYPAGLEIGEGKVFYTVNPTEDGVDIYAKNNKGKTGNKISSTKLKQYLFDKAAGIREDRGVYYDNFTLDSKNYTDNGDGTYTIIGSYGTGGLDLHEQERLKIANWENIDRSDINAEQRAILDLSTSPIYQTYDEMINLEQLRKLQDERSKLETDADDSANKISALNQLSKSTYDKYIQLTNALGKEFLDSAEATNKYRAALNKELKSYKIDDIDQQTIKSNLSAEEYEKFLDAQRTLFEVARFQNSGDSGMYHSKNGILFVKEGYNPTGFVDTAIAKKILEGNAVDTEALEGEDLTAALSTKGNKEARKAMQKAIDKNQNKGSIHWKNAEAYKAVKESAMDKMSARYTLNNYIEFENQTRDILTGMGLAEDYKVLMAKDYSDMMQRIAGKNGGIENNKIVTKFLDTMTHAANLNKAIQDWQLAGGFSNYNAATIAYIRGAIFNDPRMALEYLKVFADAKNSNHAMNSVVQAREFLYKMVARTGDTTLITDLNAAISTKPGQGDMGTINSLVSRLMEHFSSGSDIEGKNPVSRTYARFADDMDALFSDATFKNTFPLFKLRMLQINYDEALRYFKSFKGWEKYSAHDLEDACMWMAYAKTMDFIEPRKTRGNSWEEYTKNIANEELRRSAASWTGAKRNASLMDNASNVFFALRWKMTFGGRLLNGITNTPGAIMRKLQLRNADISNPEVLSTASKQFMRSGNTTGVATMLVLSTIAMLWNRSLGYNSVSWDDLNIIGEDGEFQVPNILKKFQTLGQFWFPNGTNTEGRPVIDPTQRMYGVDPFSSIFTMSNTVSRAFDKLVNPNAYAKNMQRGIIGSHSSSDAINGFINSPFFQAFGDELIASNLLSPYKAIYEVIVDDTYFGNNIWEKRKLADGTDNPNYDPFRNMVAGVAHILNFDFLLGGTNKWVKGYGTDSYVNTGKIGTVAGSGVFQHEFITAATNIMNGEALEGIIEAGELPIKTKNLSASARTDFNVRVKNIISQYVQEYKDKVGSMTNLDAKDAEYAKLVKKCADVVADWSAKNKFVLGKDQELVAYVTKTLMAICAGEYNDNLDYVQNAYWKATQIAQIEQSEDLFLGDPDLERYINEGKSVEEFAAEKNRRSEAYNQAIDDEYQARMALKEAGLPDSFLQAYEDVYGSTSKTDFKTEMRSVNRKVFAQIHGVLEGQIGEFKNFKEMKAYYEAQIDAASTTKQKAKLADKYNDILKDAISPYIEEYGAAILADGYYNNQNLANSIAEYVILPADEYYYGKTPRASYLRDQFGVGYRNKDNLPSDKEVYEKYTNALKRVHEGASASASAMLDRLIRDYRNGRVYISGSDYSKIVRLKAQLNARSNQ